MKIPILSSLLHSSKKAEPAKFSQKFKQLAKNSNLLILENVDIYHHAQKHHIPLIIFDKERGLYIFEIKQWSFKELQGAVIEKKENVEEAENTLAYGKLHETIRRKFNELIHNDGNVEIFNYLLMENLTSQEYEQLADSFKELLPQEKIIFQDSTQDEILNKLHKAATLLHEPLDVNKILGTLFIQYTLIDNNRVLFATEEQREFIDKELEKIENLTGHKRSGKSNLLLLKALKELLDNNVKNIVIIKPTLLAKDLLQKKLIELIERAIVEVDVSKIIIMTPRELLNKHLFKLKKEPLADDFIYIEPKLMQKSFHIADLLICDDAHLLPPNFINYIKHIQSSEKLLLVDSQNDQSTFMLRHSYLNPNRIIKFYKMNPYAKTMHILKALSASSSSKDIIVVSEESTREKLQEDLNSFIGNETLLLNSADNLINQDLNNILLTTYKDINELQAKHIIMLDVCSADQDLVEYASNLASESLYIVYEQSCSEIERLKEKYESTKEPTGVERTTNT